jgi:putative acetyltransferase
MAITVQPESPLQDDVRGLVEELNRALLRLTPRAFCSHLTVEEMAQPDTTTFVARDEDGAAVAVGALRRHPGGVGEVKRMFTVQSHQGQGVGGAVLDAVERLALDEGLTELVLETGDRHPAAWRVYERAGFTRTGPVLGYPDSPWSVFYVKPLAVDVRSHPVDVR